MVFREGRPDVYLHFVGSCNLTLRHVVWELDERAVYGGRY